MNQILLETYLSCLNEEFILQEMKFPSVSSLTDSYKKNIQVIDKVLEDHKITKAEIRSQAEKIASTIKAYSKQGLSSKELASRIQPLVSHSVKSKISDLTSSGNLPLEVIKSIGMTFAIALMNDVAMIVLGGGPAAMIMTVSIFAPLAEELGKNIALRGKYPWVYTGVFSGIEAIMYIIRFSKVPYIFLYRAMGIALHFTTTYVQKKVAEKELSTDSGLEKGYFAGVLIHSLYNSFWILLNFLQRGV